MCKLPLVLFSFTFLSVFSSLTLKATQALASGTPVANEQISVFLLPSVSSQTDEERQQALQAFTAQSFLGSPQQNTISNSGSVASAPTFPSPTSSSEHRTKMKRGPRKKQNEKYRLKYLRLRKAASAMIFVSKLLTLEKLEFYVFFHIMHFFGMILLEFLNRFWWEQFFVL